MQSRVELGLMQDYGYQSELGSYIVVTKAVLGLVVCLKLCNIRYVDYVESFTHFVKKKLKDGLMTPNKMFVVIKISQVRYKMVNKKINT